MDIWFCMFDKKPSCNHGPEEMVGMASGDDFEGPIPNKKYNKKDLIPKTNGWTPTISHSLKSDICLFQVAFFFEGPPC